MPINHNLLMKSINDSVVGRTRSRALLVLMVSLFWAAPAHAFISLTWEGLALGLLILAWPWLMPLFALLLVRQWKRRQEQTKRLIATALMFLMGTVLWLSHAIPEWQSSARWTRNERAWQDIDTAADKQQFDQAWKLITEHPEGNVYVYLQRQIEQRDHEMNVPFAKFIFARCIGLTDQVPYKGSNELLRLAISEGRYELVEAWLETTPCRPPDGRDREQDLMENRDRLLPYAHGRHDPVSNAADQSRALMAVVKRYPALLSALPTEKCWKKSRADDSCSLLMRAFLERHHLIVKGLVEMDADLIEHVPALVAHVLKDDGPRVREAALKDPFAVKLWLPELFASAPLNALQIALNASPLDEHALVTGDEKNTPYQLLSPTVEEAQRRDLNQETWKFLNLLLDQFPTQLSKIDPYLLSGYGTKPLYEQPQGQMLMRRLREAGMTCEGMQEFVSWGSVDRDTGTQAMALVGCKPPEDWSPYVPKTPA